jgi:hypothetical protein
VRQLLAKELQLARQHVTNGAMDDADRHITIALRLSEASPTGAIPPQVINMIVWAGHAVVARDRDVVLMALDQGLRLLEEVGVSW